MHRCALPLLLALLLAAAGVSAATVTISCGAVGVELALCREGAEAWATQSGHSVEVVSTPNSSSDRLALYQLLLAAHSPDIDVFQIDVVWPGILGRHFEDLRPHVSARRLAAQFPVAVANNTLDERLVALPWFLDAGLLYYRRDLLERHGLAVPGTWAELTETAARVQAAERAAGNDELWGFVWQGRAYEGLTCDALEWVAAHGGGGIVAADGAITVDNAGARAALERAAGWVEAITPLGVLNYAEEEARGVFQSGRALFMRNWPYAWPLLNAPDSPVRGKVGVARLPAGADGQRASTLGGWQLAVSRYSEASEAAIDLVLYLTGRAEQRRRAAKGYYPTWPELYTDPALADAGPLARLLPVVLAEDAVARPSGVTGPRYNQVSHAFWSAVHRVLSGREATGPALAELERSLLRLRRGEAW